MQGKTFETMNIAELIGKIYHALKLAQIHD